MSLLPCAACGLQLGVFMETGANHCLNAACRTNTASRNSTLTEILKLAESSHTNSPMHAETSRTNSPERVNVPRERAGPWSPHSLRVFAEARAQENRLIKLWGTNDPIECTQMQKNEKRRRLRIG